MRTGKHSLVWVVPLLLVLIPEKAYSQTDLWTSMNGPYRVFVEDLIKTTQGRLIAATQNGLVTSTDQGNTWVHLAIGNVWEPFFTCVIEDSLGHLFAGTAAEGVWKSTNGGTTWDALEKELFSTLWVTSLAVFSSNDLLAGTSSGLYRSTDGGTSWTKQSSVDFQVETLAIDKQKVLYVGTFDKGMFRSSDRGSTWLKLQLDDDTTRTIYVNDLELASNGSLIAAASGRIYRSSDQGMHWIRSYLPDSTHVEVSALSINERGEVYAGAWNPALTEPFQIMRSTDEGDTWVEVNYRNNYYGQGIGCLLADSSGNIFVGSGSGGGVIRSSDGGNIWAPCIISYNRSSGSHVYQSVSRLAVDPTSRRAYAATPSGIFRLAQDGSGWILLGQLGAIPFAINDFGTMLVPKADDIFRFDLQTSSWTRVLQSTKVPGFLTIVADPSGVFYAGTINGRVYRSSNQGGDWTVSKLPDNVPITDITVAMGIVYAISNDGWLYESSDSARNWTARPALGIPYAYCIASNAAGHLFAGGYPARGVLRSTNNGSNWETIPLPVLEDLSITDIEVDPSGHIFASASNRGNAISYGGEGVYQSTDDGANWHAYKTGLNGRDFRSLAISSQGLLYAGSEFGVFRHDSPITSVSSHTHAGSMPLFLAQNYPNPFNPATTIQFSLQKEERVGLKVFNLLGEEVATLLSERLQAGQHSVKWNATGARSGVYFYRLQAGEFTETKKLILLK